MRLKHITAVPHPGGNRIDLSWVNPDPGNYPGVLVVRRIGTHPASPEDGVVVAEIMAEDDEQGELSYNIPDSNLKGETVYYYGWFPYKKGNPTDFAIGQANLAAAMATSPYGMADQMYELLPAIYHRYDASLSQAAGAEGKPGPLRRFLDLPGSQLDQLHSQARAMLDLYDPDQVDGRLLPLLAQWIGWQTDYRRDMETQRNELRNAPYIYQNIGIIPTVEATVKRILGWESRTKEFVHNVALSNRPERLNLWLLQRAGDGAWPDAGKLLSLDFAYAGRAAAARDGNDTVWLFYHTLQRDRWEIWYKMLDGGQAVGDYTWSPSQPLGGNHYLDRHPAAVFHRNQLWVFWDSYDDKKQTWRLRFQSRGSNDAWSGIETFGENERRAPAAVADKDGGLWLFWLEKTGMRWQLHYNRHNGSRWQLSIPSLFSATGGDDPRVEDDVFVLSHPTDPGRKLWIFWARKEQLSNTGQTCWQIAYRFKANLDPKGSGWSAIFTLPKGERADADDREPAAWINEAGKLELFWSSTRDGSWSIWRTLLDELDPKPVTRSPYSQHAPLLLPLVDDLQLIYRSNESLAYTSTVYSATETLDNRYAGCTTVDARNAGKTALHGQFEDFQTYTYVSSRGDVDWYARDTIGVYLTPTTEEPAVISENRRRIRAVLRQFLPIQVRTVFVIEPAVYTEAVYTYEFPQAENPRLIVEARVDTTVTAVTQETYSGLNDSRRDTVWGWIWVRCWSNTYSYHHTVDFTQAPVTAPFRTWHTDLTTKDFVIEPAVYSEAVHTYDFPDAEPPRLIADANVDYVNAVAEETYSGLGDNRQDTVGGWIWVRSWSNTYSYHHAVDFTQAPVTAPFRTWHTDLTTKDFVIEPAVYSEAVHTYDFPDTEPPRLIAEAFVDRVNAVAEETYGGFLDSRSDTVPAWIRVRSWSSTHPDHRTVDVNQSPVATTFRTWHTSLTTGD